eukprot:421941-Prymnesium_polylepis.1
MPSEYSAVARAAVRRPSTIAASRSPACGLCASAATGQTRSRLKRPVGDADGVCRSTRCRLHRIRNRRSMSDAVVRGGPWMRMRDGRHLAALRRERKRNTNHDCAMCGKIVTLQIQPTPRAWAAARQAV